MVLHLNESGRYSRRDRSLSLPMLPPYIIEDSVRRRNSADDTTLMTEFRQWVREHLIKS